MKDTTSDLVSGIRCSSPLRHNQRRSIHSQWVCNFWRVQKASSLVGWLVRLCWSFTFCTLWACLRFGRRCRRTDETESVQVALWSTEREALISLVRRCRLFPTRSPPASPLDFFHCVLLPSTAPPFPSSILLWVASAFPTSSISISFHALSLDALAWRWIAMPTLI